MDIRGLPSRANKHMRSATWDVWRDSLFTALLASSFAFYALELWDIEVESPIVRALALLSIAIPLVLTWGESLDWWEAICRPFQRSDRIHREDKIVRERHEREAAERARIEEEREQARLLRLSELTREWSPNEHGFDSDQTGPAKQEQQGEK